MTNTTAVTTTVETDKQRFDRLADELRALRRVHPDERTNADRARLTAVTLELRELAAAPPDGYALPAAAANMIVHARAHGWDAWALWTPDTGTSGGPFVTVHARGAGHHYEITWHSRGCQPGKVRLFGQGLARTPDNPAPHGAPSVRGIREVIAKHPAFEGKP